MAGQERVQKSKSQQRREEVQAEAAEAKTTDEEAEAKKAEWDELIDSIDDLLEENAQEFVAGFIQKGGE